jgi:transposase-like protein
VTETGKPLPEVANDLGINETTPARWVSRAKRAGKPTVEDRDSVRNEWREFAIHWISSTKKSVVFTKNFL